MKNILTYTFILCLISVQSCVKEPDPVNVPIKAGKHLLVCNEGNYQMGNASLTLFHLDSGYLVNSDIFKQVNQRPVGDVLQSISKIDDMICLVVNNSGKLEFIDATTYASVASISGLRSPRYVCPSENNNSVALVTDIYDDSVAIVQLKPAYKVLQKTAIKGWTEQVVFAEGNFFVTNPQSFSVYVVDGNTFDVIDSIPVGFGSFAAVTDYKGRLWVATKGDKTQGIGSKVSCIDPVNHKVVLSQNVSAEPIQCMAVDETGKNIYLVRDHVYKFSVDQQPQFTQPFFTSQNHNFYGVLVADEKVFLADAIDYNQNGNIYILNHSGSVLQQFKAGKIPNGFLILN